MDLLYKELTYMPHKPANNHSDYKSVFKKYGHHRNLSPEKE